MLLNKSVSLRAATRADWPAIAALLTANKLPTQGAQEHLNGYLVAIADGGVAGCAGAEVYGDIALLRSVAVAPGLHRRGIGRALVDGLLHEARHRHINKLYLLTVTAPEYFAQYGFKRGAIDQAPAALHASAEFQGACPACAAFMSLTLNAPARARDDLPVAIIGAGPVGLAAAARLLERGMQPLVLEAGATVGANLLAYAHVRLFSPWQYNIDSAMAALLAASGWLAPPAGELPLAGEVVERVLKPFAALPRVAAALRLNTEVLAISRDGFDKVKTSGRDGSAFVIRAVRDGQPIELRARAVVDASGTWRTPNPLGADGLPAVGEREHAHAIFYGIPDVLGAQRSRYAGKRTLVVGAGHSAANALLALADLARTETNTQLAWAVRTPTLTRVFGGGDTDALPARGQLGAALKGLRDSARLEFISGLRIQAIQRDGATLTIVGCDVDQRSMHIGGIDQIICATGQRPELSLTRELRLNLDPWLESSAALGPLIDPNLHSCGTVRPHGHRELAHAEVGFYTLGVKSYGRAPTFLMATGFEQARSVVAALAGDMQAADRVALDLPATGVCNLAAVEVPSVGSACCSANTGSAGSVGSVGNAASATRAPTPSRVAVAVNAAVATTPARCCG